MMQILCAPDKFKGSLTAAEAAECMADGIHRADPATIVDQCPIADGGEGSIDALLQGMKNRAVTICETEVAGPRGRSHPVTARWIIINDKSRKNATAVIELASAAGLSLIPSEQQNPMNTTTFGVGELIANAIDCPHVHKVTIALGGSATCDGGCGIAQALGAVFRLENGETLGPFDRAIFGRDLKQIVEVNTADLQQRITNHLTLTAACDVRNPLLGPTGAALFYAPQKGASPDETRHLQSGLENLTSRLRTPESVANTEWVGAAGGVGFGLYTFCNAILKPGIEVILEMLNFNDRITSADLVITGEGRLDRQSLYGKAVLGVAQRANSHRRPVIALVGSVDPALTDADLVILHGYLTQWNALTEMNGVTGEADAVIRAGGLLTTQTEWVIRRFLRQESP